MKTVCVCSYTDLFVGLKLPGWGGSWRETTLHEVAAILRTPRNSAYIKNNNNIWNKNWDEFTFIPFFMLLPNL